MGRRVTYGAACSLDGFIARNDSSVDWLRFTDDVRSFIAAYWEGIDTVLMGRKTWETAATAGGGGSPYGPMRSVVFSTTLTSDRVKGAELVSRDAGGFVRRLKAEKGKDICVMGGGELVASLLAEGVVDEVGVNMHPVLLGSGVPLFTDPGLQVDLDLTECRTLQEGCVLLRYDVRGGA